MAREIAMESGVASAVGRMNRSQAVAARGCALCGTKKTVSMRVKASPTGELLAVCAGCRSKYGERRAFTLAACKRLGL
jgi:hypothetical protein